MKKFIHEYFIMQFPEKQIRASYTKETIRVYQAFSNEIANSALEFNTFKSPPFKLERMTWIKPSFLWMMYRSGYATKEENQKRILALDISREGFEWALNNSCLSSKPIDMSQEQWGDYKRNTPVRVQWDPERDIFMSPLPYRAIQIGLSGIAVDYYISQWIINITDITPFVASLHQLIQTGKMTEALQLLPREIPYSF